MKRYKEYLDTFSDDTLFEFMKKQNYYEKTQCSITMDFLNRIVSIYSQHTDLYRLFELNRIKFNLVFNYPDNGCTQILCNCFLDWGTERYPCENPFYDKVTKFQTTTLVDTVHHEFNFLKKNILSLLSWNNEENDGKNYVNLENEDRCIIQVLDSDSHLDGFFIQYAEV